jgi:thiol-disulfide isomerase/thioredoxin
MIALWRLAAAIATAAALRAGAEQALRPWIKPTPPLALKDLAGTQVDLKALRGHVVVVNFWATWCEPCVAEMPSLQRLGAKLGGRADVLAVNYGESRAKVDAFLRKTGISLHVLLDPDKQAADEWGARGLPMTFIVDRAGRVRLWTFGERDWSGGDSLAAVEKLVAEAGDAGR